MAMGMVVVGGNVGGGSGGGSSADVQTHNADAKAHPSIQAALSELKTRILTVEAASGVEVTANPFAASFADLDGLVTKGIWNTVENRLEF